MKPTILPLLAAVVLAGCASNIPDKAVKAPSREPAVPPSATRTAPSSSAWTVDGYKRDAARYISEANASRVFPGRPQPLLRSVIVMKYAIDSQGRVTRSEIMRSNHDDETESIALHSLRSASPLPRPAAHLLHNGHLEVIETWLFNDDGRFQLRTVALPQMDN
jgi:protein TonB